MYRRTVAAVVGFIYRRTFAGDASLMMRATAADVSFRFPGSSSFAASLEGRERLRAWLDRFTTLDTHLDIREAVVSGPPWNMTVAVRFRDSIGTDYQNEGVEWLHIRWGRVRSIEVFLDTERVTAWERRHPELAQSTPTKPSTRTTPTTAAEDVTR
jgi:ketosteroid isomerase-like protein